MTDPPSDARSNDPSATFRLSEAEASRITRMALEMAKVGYAVEDVATRMIVLSEGLWRQIGMPGAPKPVALGRFADMVIDPAYWEDARRMRASAIETGEAYASVFPMRRADDGRRVTLEITATPERGRDGKVARIVSVSKDITQEFALRRALEQERNAYQRAQELARVGHYVLDLQTGLVTASEGLARIVGLPHADKKLSMEAVLGQIFSPEELEASRERRKRSRETGEAYDVETEVRTGDTGERRAIAVHVAPISDRTGRVVSQFGVVRDITEFRAAEADIAARERLLLRAESLGQIGHFYNDFVERRTHFSPMMYEIFGVDAVDEAVLGSYRLRGAVPDRDIKAFEDAGRDAVAVHAPSYAFSLRFQRKGDGTHRWVDIETLLEYDADGGLKASFGLARDMTDFATIQRQLEFRDQFFVRAQQLARMAHWHHDFVSGETYWSQGMYEIFGLGHEIDGLSGMDRLRPALAPGEGARFVRTGRQAVRAGLTQFVDQLDIIRPTDGAGRTIRADTTVEYGADGRATAIFGVNQDVTDQLAERRQLDELQRSAAEANRMETLNFFAGALAHELSNMLQPALSFGSLTKRALEDADVSNAQIFLDNVMAAITRARGLTRSTLDFVRVENVDVAAMLVADAVAPARTLLAAVAKRIVWSVPTPAGRALAHVEADGLLQILLNLVRNAINAGGEDVQITVSVAEDAAGVLLTVEDDGPGMPMEDLETIFEPLFTRRQADGAAGLGLPIARRIVERWGGSIHAESVVGGGTTFFIRLRRASR